MSDNVVSILNQFTTPKTSSQTTSALESYEAATLEPPHRRAYGIRINYSDGMIAQPDYALYKYTISASSDRLAIFFTIGVAVVTGQNVRSLLDGLLDQRTRSIQAFDPKRHKPLKDGEPRIDRILWQSQKDIDRQIDQEMP